MLQNRKGIFNIESVEDLCNILDISKRQLNYLLFVKDNNYVVFEVNKRNGEKRRICAPTIDLKIVQKRLVNILADSYDFLDVQHGFIRQRSCVTNASLHIGKRYVLNIDLENFFDTIHFGRVRGLFMNNPFYFNEHLATILAKLVCYDGSLPQGAPTSPIISNIICYRMDRELAFLAKKNRCVYTRYADDITFSTNSDRFPTQIAYKSFNEVVLSNQLLNIINGGYEHGFRINNSKTKLSRCMMSQEVTGIIVNKKMNIRKKYIKNVRAILHSIEKYGFVDVAKKNFNNIVVISEAKARDILFNFLQGKLNYLKMVRGYNDKIFLKYAKEFNRLFDVDFFDVDSIIDFETYVTDRCLVLESEERTSQGTAFLVKGNTIYTSTHVFINKTTFPAFIYDEIDPQYLSQFSINSLDGRLPFFYLKRRGQKKFVYFDILESNYKSDIFCMKNNFFTIKEFEIAKTSPKVNDKVYLIGYPDFWDFDNNGITIIETKITGHSTFFGRKFCTTIDSPKHGMSGGPVLNEKREVVGIIYAGADLNYDSNSSQVGFIALV